MVMLNQKLNTKDDSFTYTLPGDSEPLFKVDNNAALYLFGKQIGKYKLANNEWQLWIDGVLLDTSGADTLFYLPEFELDSLNQILEKSSAQYHDGNHVSTEELKANLKARFGV
ncbi:hypothetical protein PHB09_157 [Pseudomonas phage PHB09]|uniref:Uncharacterized protein n=1 Tax=Pseudomonas phage PHB09 TaxID=2867265 RepID=A0AAE8XD98_9CAUD|nr:hypothetical protein QGX10_gp156 [Pseudomonas phage PHB09]UAV84652.1 hypothetical protein PHB09_157 [Pseudomonas phage PHB09]